MFHTEELQQIINQLQNTDGLGYFDTLLLILKLLGLCGRPVLFITVIIATLYFIPKYVSCKQTVVPNGMKLYNVYYLKDKRLGLKYQRYKITDPYENLLIKRGRLRYKLTWIFAPFSLILLSPLFFINTLVTCILFVVIIMSLMFLILEGLSCIGDFHNWTDLATKEHSISDEYKIVLQFDEDINKILESLKNTDTKKMNLNELKQHLDIKLENSQCEAIIKAK